MKRVLLDTHSFAWALYSEARLSPIAVRELQNAHIVLFSAASFYEIAQKVRLGKWPEMQPFVADLLTYVSRQGVDVIPVDADISLRAGTMAWGHRDPFDRLIAATALEHALPIISADTAFDGVVSRIW